MNADIVARLRTLTDTLLLGDFQGLAATTESAADEIERLRAENATLRRLLDQFVGEFKDEVQREAL